MSILMHVYTVCKMCQWVHVYKLKFFQALLSPFVKICKCKHVPRNLIFLYSILKLLCIIIVLRSYLTEEQQSLSLSQHFGRLDTASAVRSNNSTRICMLFKIPFPLSYHYNKYLTSMFCKFTCINFQNMQNICDKTYMQFSCQRRFVDPQITIIF